MLAERATWATVNRLSASNRERFREFVSELGESRLRKASQLILQERPGRMLDIGCGDGAFGRLFVGRGFQVHGVDLTRNLVALARSNGLQALVHDVATSPLPYRGDAFDVVFAGEVIEHLVDTTAFLQDIRRVLRPGGVLVLTTPNLASFENRIRLLLGLYPRWVEYKLEGGHGHLRAYTARSLLRHLADTGFAVERHVGNWVPFIPQRYADDVRYPALAWTGTLMPSLSMDTIVKARKTLPAS